MEDTGETQGRRRISFQLGLRREEAVRRCEREPSRERWGERWSERGGASGGASGGRSRPTLRGQRRLCGYGARTPSSLRPPPSTLRPPPSTLGPRPSAHRAPPATLPPSLSDCERAPPVDELLAVVLERLEDVELELEVVLEELLDEQVHRDLVLGPALLQRGVLVRSRAGVRPRARSGGQPWPNLWPQRASARRALKVMYFSQSAGGVARKTSW